MSIILMNPSTCGGIYSVSINENNLFSSMSWHNSALGSIRTRNNKQYLRQMAQKIKTLFKWSQQQGRFKVLKYRWKKKNCYHQIIRLIEQKKKEIGFAGFRSPYLPHAKRTCYQVHHEPVSCPSCLKNKVSPSSHADRCCLQAYLTP